jgi:hypothetical protein
MPANKSHMTPKEVDELRMRTLKGKDGKLLRGIVLFVGFLCIGLLIGYMVGSWMNK